MLIAASAWAIFRLLGADIDMERFRRSFQQMHYGWLAAGTVLVLLTYAGRAIRWRVMISPERPQANLTGLLKATIIGFTAVTLFGRPGELVRPYLIAKRERLPVSSQVAVWFLERIYDLLFVILIFGFGLTRVQPHSGLSPGLQWIFHTGGYFVAALGILCVTILIALSVFTETASRRIRDALMAVPEQYRDRLDALVTSFAGGMASTSRGSYVAQLLALTISEWIIIIGANYCLFQSIPATRELTIADNVVFLGFVAFGSIVQIPGIGGGMQIASVLVLTELFGLRVEPAMAVALLLWITMSVVIVPLGLVLALLEGLTWGALRHVEDTSSTGVIEAR